MQEFDPYQFEGLPGVFDDSLPDAWGRLLLKRVLEGRGGDPDNLTALDRLCHVGSCGMGALVYEPDLAEPPPSGRISVDDLSVQAEEVLAGRDDGAADNLLRSNGSAGGARPKAMIGLSAEGVDAVGSAEPLPPGYEHWLVKLQNAKDGADAGAVEYVYAQMARQAGIRMPPARLIPSRSGAGHFAVKRFDRLDGGRLHMHTAGGLYHTSSGDFALDYTDLIQLALDMTQDIGEAERMYRQAAFNVLAWNRDDHCKNFSFLMDRDGNWTLSPAYDLTFSLGPDGQHCTTVMGEAERPTRAGLLRLAEAASVPSRKAIEILDQTRSALAEFRELATEHGVSREKIEEISGRLAEVERGAGFTSLSRGRDGR